MKDADDPTAGGFGYSWADDGGYMEIDYAPLAIRLMPKGVVRTSASGQDARNATRREARHVIRAYSYHDPDEQLPEARAFSLARLELAERLAGDEGVPHGRMRSADGGLYLLLKAEGSEGRRAFSGLVLALDGYHATESLLFEFEDWWELSSGPCRVPPAATSRAPRVRSSRRSNRPE